MASTTRPAIFYAVPIGTPSRTCTKCPATIYFVRTTNSYMPVDCSVEGGEAPTAEAPGRGGPHWGTCPGAAEFRKAKV